jgi:esterase
MKLFFRKSGEGPPLIILHGLFGMSDNWASLARTFSAQGFTVYTPDLRNHGQSPHAADFNYAAMAEDLLGLLDDEGLRSAAVAGHSLGGKTAMFLACLHPQRVSRLVVVDIAPRYYPPHHQQVLAALHAVDPAAAASRGEAERQMEAFMPDAGVRQFLLKNLFWKEAGNEKQLAWRFNLAGIEREIDKAGEALPAGYVYNGPALFIRGERSSYIGPDDERPIRSHFPAAVIRTVAGAGHWVHADNPAGFAQCLLEFLTA